VQVVDFIAVNRPLARMKHPEAWTTLSAGSSVDVRPSCQNYQKKHKHEQSRLLSSACRLC
jgi:hypothetical protein